jgi:hypothetical protein
MSSLEFDSEREPASKVGVLFRLLDPAFGFFVWAIHFLIVYIAAAVACALGLGAATASARSTLLIALVLVTLAAIAVLAIHGTLRYRQMRGATNQQFRMSLALGGDAIAAVAVLWQLFPIMLVPLCA